MAGIITFPYKDGNGASRNAIAASDASGNTATAVTLTDVNGAPLTTLAVATRTTTVTYTDRSGSITTGGTAQQAAPANASRAGFWIQNRSTANLYLNSSGTASSSVGPSNGSIEIEPGQIYEPPSWGIPGTALSIFGATTGQAFVLKDC
jgi:hypothetical protein